ncbi:MAG: hypothetical protein ACREFP_20695 [Acetobacteraceae bacterium]
MRCSVEEAVAYGHRLKEVSDGLNAAAATQLGRALDRKPRDREANDVEYTYLIFSLFDVGKALQQVVNALDGHRETGGTVDLSLPVIQQLALYGIIPPLQPGHAPLG